jgi:hypothetical protein
VRMEMINHHHARHRAKSDFFSAGFSGKHECGSASR